MIDISLYCIHFQCIRGLDLVSHTVRAKGANKKDCQHDNTSHSPKIHKLLRFQPQGLKSENSCKSPSLIIFQALQPRSPDIPGKCRDTRFLRSSPQSSTSLSQLRLPFTPFTPGCGSSEWYSASATSIFGSICSLDAPILLVQ